MDDISDPSSVSHHTQLDFSPCHATQKDLAHSYYGHGKCELAMSVKPISQGGWRGACWWCRGAVLQSRVLAVLPRIMAVPLPPAKPWVAVGTSEACCDPQLHEPISREGLWYKHFPALMAWGGTSSYITFSLFCLLAMSVVEEEAASQPMHAADL